MAIDGTPGDDLLNGTPGNDLINGFGGADTLFGLDGDDLINAGDGDDYLVAGTVFVQGAASFGFDTLNGGAGDDTLEAAEIVDIPANGGGVFDGGTGTDRAIFRGGFFIPQYDVNNPASDFKIGVYPNGGGTAGLYSLTGVEVVEFDGVFSNPDAVFELGVGTGGANLLSASLGMSFRAYGGGGADTLTGGAFDDWLTGDGGGDSLVGGAGIDTLQGAAGADTLVGGADSDLFSIVTGSDIAGAGDTISDFSSEDGVTFDAGFIEFERMHFIGASAFSGTSQELRYKIIGGRTIIEYDADGDGVSDGLVTIANGAFSLRMSSEFDQTLQIAVVATSTIGDDTIRGTVGNDAINGAAGDDWLNTTLGDDAVNGGVGDDRVIGGEGADTLTGGAGMDIFRWYYNYELGSYAGVVTDVITDFDGVDLIDLPSSFLSQKATDYVFTLWIGASAFSGAAGEFRYQKISGRTEVLIDVDGDAAADHIINITNGAFDLWMTSGDLRLVSGAATTGNDSLGGMNSADSIDGLSGDDFIVGLSGADTLIGGTGDDTLYGDQLNDFIIGGAGADSVDGGLGLDTASYADATGAVTVNLNSGTGTGDVAQGDFLSNIENVNGGNFNDVLTGAHGVANWLGGGFGNDNLNGFSGNDTIVGGSGNDTLTGNFGVDNLDGGAGTDMANYSDATARVVVRLWNGTGEGNLAQGDVLTNIENLNGSNFNDILFGADIVANFIIGGNGPDYMNGLSGNDTMLGGSGNDSLAGGSGADRHDFSAGSGADRVFNMITGAGAWDVIRITGYGAAFDSFAEILANSLQVGADTIINLGGGNTITLVGVLKTSLVADDFTFI